MKKAIITGANGFIGSWLIKELLENNIEVIAVVRNEKSNVKSISDKARMIYCELSSIAELANKIMDRDIDIFYHLAWSGNSGKSRADYELQLLNSKYACDCAIVAKKINCEKFICTGTITEKIAEEILDNNCKAENIIYGIAKHTTHCLLDVLCRKLELPFIWARLSNIYGSNNFTGNIISYALGEMQKGKIPAFSKADQIYDLMYIKDTARALYLLGEKEAKQNAYFIGSGSPRILREYLIELKDILGGNSTISLGEKPDDGLKYFKEWFEISSLVEDTGFESMYTFKDGIREIIETNKL